MILDLQCLTMSRLEPKSSPVMLVAALVCLAWAASALVLGLVHSVAARLRRPRLQCRGPGGRHGQWGQHIGGRIARNQLLLTFISTACELF